MRIKLKNKFFIIKLITLTIFMVLPEYNALSADSNSPTFPYFASIKAQIVNMRTGPGTEYPIKWVYTKKNLPIKIVGEFEQWKKIQDITGDEGWIMTGLLNSKVPYVMLKENTKGYKNPNINSHVKIKVDKLVIAKLKKCQQDWCLIEFPGKKAWVKKNLLWGINESK